MELAAVLHDVRSVHNVGSIFRTADAAGVSKIYLCGITPAPIDRFKEVRKDFAKVALGAERSVKWESVKDTKDAVARLKRDGYEVLAVEQSPDAVSCEKVVVKKNMRLALVMGNEVQGLPPAVLALADKTIEIPMFGKKESLNVSVAFGIVAFVLRLKA